MLPKDKILIARLRSRSALLITLSICLAYWIRMKYLDEEYQNWEIESLQYELSEKNSEILQLKNKIQTLNSGVRKTNDKKSSRKPKIIINTNKIETKKDTSLPKIIEVTPVLPSDESLDTVSVKS